MEDRDADLSPCNFAIPHFPAERSSLISPCNFATRLLKACILSGPLDRLNAILSLLQPLNRYRAPSAIGSAIGRPLSRPISHPCKGRSSQPPHSKPLRGAQPRDSGAIVSQTPLKQARNENAIEAAILNCVLDRDWSLNRRGPLSLHSGILSPLNFATHEMEDPIHCFVHLEICARGFRTVQWAEGKDSEKHQFSHTNKRRHKNRSPPIRVPPTKVSRIVSLVLAGLRGLKNSQDV